MAIMQGKRKGSMVAVLDAKGGRVVLPGRADRQRACAWFKAQRGQGPLLQLTSPQRVNLLRETLE